MSGYRVFSLTVPYLSFEKINKLEKPAVGHLNSLFGIQNIPRVIVRKND